MIISLVHLADSKGQFLRTGRGLTQVPDDIPTNILQYAFTGLTQVQTLKLHYTGIIYIDPGSFKNPTLLKQLWLKQLWLNGNKISSLKCRLFENMFQH